MTTDSSISSKRRNRLLRSVMNALHGYKRKRKNNQLKVAVSLPLIGMEDSQLIANTKSSSCTKDIDVSSNQKALTSRLSIKSLTKAIHDSGVSMSRSTSLTSCIEILPNSDIQELDRMVSQHYILRTAFDADYSAPIILSVDRERPCKVVVLDIGCGSGTWTMEMATQFPQAHFIGVDKQASFPHDIKPKNCHFKLFEINQSAVKLPFQDQSVDYIFQRDLNWNLSETTWLPLVKEFFRVLKPGGWVELVEPDIETHSTSSYEDFLTNKLIDAFHHRQQDPFISKRLSSFMAVAGFRRIQSDFQSIPLGWGYQKLCTNAIQPAKKDHRSLRCSEFARAAASHRLDLLKTLQPWFTRENNVSKTKYNNYISQLPDEWYSAKSYTNWHRSTAQKPYNNDIAVYSLMV
ncbi:type 11 methyltransferase [Mucor ambiguus]|uniref:Type 11 methyltransferase n=1 Tax=Mucor ambiguus TaxID=91626 RepID=A0A0C9N2Z4_9FUNG|nr:type 11 methyltransferase [Mucor ambiguus]